MRGISGNKYGIKGGWRELKGGGWTWMDVRGSKYGIKGGWRELKGGSVELAGMSMESAGMSMEWAGMNGGCRGLSGWNFCNLNNIVLLNASVYLNLKLILL